MKQSKLSRLVREFPFLQSILFGENLRTDSIGNIVVKRGDPNLLEVTPHAWAHDLGGWGNDEGCRRFWLVNDEVVIQLESSWHCSSVPHGERFETATPIGSQLQNLGLQVGFIVEVNQPSHDTSSCISQSPPCVMVYNMRGFDWPSHW